jgi:hypothetical protein
MHVVSAVGGAILVVVAFTPMVTNFFVWLPLYHTYYCVEGFK